jgi:hypothetical protein
MNKILKRTIFLTIYLQFIIFLSASFCNAQKMVDKDLDRGHVAITVAPAVHLLPEVQVQAKANSKIAPQPSLWNQLCGRFWSAPAKAVDQGVEIGSTVKVALPLPSQAQEQPKANSSAAPQPSLLNRLFRRFWSAPAKAVDQGVEIGSTVTVAPPLSSQAQEQLKTRAKKKAPPQPSLFDRFLGGMCGVPANGFTNRAYITKLFILGAFFLPKVQSIEEHCKLRLSGSAHCFGEGEVDSVCSYLCDKGVLRVPRSLTWHSEFHVDNVGGHMIASCSRELWSSYSAARTDILNNQDEIDEISVQLAASTGGLEDAERRKRRFQDFIVAAERRLEKIEEEAADHVANRWNPCPEPIGDKRILPLPGPASATCEDTSMGFRFDNNGEPRSIGETCSYYTRCWTRDGRKIDNQLAVYQMAKDCIAGVPLRSASTYRQKNCDGTLIFLPYLLRECNEVTPDNHWEPPAKPGDPWQRPINERWQPPARQSVANQDKQSVVNQVQSVKTEQGPEAAQQPPVDQQKQAAANQDKEPVADQVQLAQSERDEL